VFRAAAHRFKYSSDQTPRMRHRGEPLRIGCQLTTTEDWKPQRESTRSVLAWLSGLLQADATLEAVVLAPRSRRDFLEDLAAKFHGRLRILPDPSQRLALMSTAAESAECSVWVTPSEHPAMQSSDLSFPTPQVILQVTPPTIDRNIDPTPRIFLSTTVRDSFVSATKDHITPTCVHTTAPPNSSHSSDIDRDIFKILKRPYLFISGVMINLENFKAVLNAFRILREEYGIIEWDFVIGNDNLDWSEELQLQIQHGRLEEHVHRLPPLDSATLREVYRKSVVVVFPSQDDVCGLSLHEALDCDVPVVCADITVYREWLGASLASAEPTNEFPQIFFQPDQPRSIARALFAIYERRESILSAQRKHIESILSRTWCDDAHQTIEWLREIVAHWEKSHFKRQ
jgi:glycosyltransferase involved in cell wall biosynthesis